MYFVKNAKNFNPTARNARFRAQILFFANISKPIGPTELGVAPVVFFSRFSIEESLGDEPQFLRYKTLVNALTFVS